jgi:diguanylate cyclase (GGDEF)-like protein/PAS domain S-box-containing protein
MAAGRLTTLLSGFIPEFRQARAALFVLGLGLALSYAAWHFTNQWVVGDAARKFQHETEQAVDAVGRRFQDNINLLLGLKGLFDASDQVDRDEFQRYLAGLKFSQRYPGIRWVAFARRVTLSQKAAFEVSVRRDTSVDPRGYPDFAVKPPGDRDEYVVVTYLEPLAGNERAFGLDVLFEPGRRAEYERVRDRGEPTATGPTELVADPEHHVSLLLRVPIYRRDMPVTDAAQRRAAFFGVVTAVIRVNDLMRSLLGLQFDANFDLVIHDLDGSEAADRPAPSKASLVFDSRRSRGEAPEQADAGQRMKKVAMLEVAGRKWQLSFTSPTAAYGLQRLLPSMVLLGGIVTSLLLSWLIGTLTVSRARALRLVEQATAVRTAEGLREQLSFIQQLIETVPQPIFFKAADGRYLGVNRAWEAFFGISRDQFIGKTVFELYPNDQELARRHHARDQELFNRPGSQSYEAAIVAADGKVHHTIYNKATFNKADGAVAGLIGTITDISELKDAEAALRESEARFRSLTTLSSDWYWEQDAEYRFVDMTSNIDRTTGVSALAHIGKRHWELVVPNMTEADWAAHRAVVEAHRPFHNLELCGAAEDGSTHWASISGEPIFDRDGQFKGYRGIGKDITEQKRADDRIRHMAHYDALTGLPNRVLLYDRIAQLVAQAKRNDRVLALLFIDLDRFKNVNDSLGHQVGDRLLQAVAGRLKGCIRDMDTVARLGGDEFVVVLSDLNEPEDAGHVAQKVLESLAVRFRVETHDLHITPSVGICTYPHDGEGVETLMRSADTAMYHAKETGRNNYQFFTAAMNAAAQHRLALENDLRRALERSELSLHYQPQLDLKTEDIIGFEALVRWRHPERGMIPPAQFIPVAEETGLIDRLGEWVLQEACAQAAEWRKAGYSNLQVAVNVSARQFRRADMAGTVARVLKETGVPAARLELEITESVIIQQAEQAIVIFRDLNDMAVQLSIDDFGTGYSSLSYLKRFPIDKLKIDQAFVRDISTDPDDAAIVTAIIAMAHSLGLEVIAEGVETAEQLAFLKLLGCDKAQGYYFSKPIPAQEFASLLRSWHAQPRAVTA